MEQAETLLQTLEEFKGSPGFGLFKKIVNGVADDCYIDMLNSKTDSGIFYYQGAICCLETLMTKLDDQLGVTRDIVEEYRKEKE